MLRTRINIFLACLLLSSGAAASESYTGQAYFTALGGVNFLPNYNTSTGATVVSFSVKHRQGYNLGAEVGYQYGPLRYGVEYLHSATQVKQLWLNAANVNGSGRNNLSGGLGNIYYDFDGFNQFVLPYLGIGAGYGSMAYRLNNNLNATQSADENKSVTIYQGIAGFDFRYDCHFDVMADYRYLESRSYDVTYHNAAGANLSPLVSQRYRSNQLNLGIRYRF